MFYYHSWMFYNHFIATLYIFWDKPIDIVPSASCYFCLFFTLQNISTKRSPNAVKLFGEFFGPEDTLWAEKAHRRSPMGTTRHKGALERPGATLWFVPPPVASHTDSLLCKYPNISETLGESTKINSSRRKFQKHQIQSRHHHGGGSSCPLVPLR